MSRTAVVLFNLGGPDSLQAVRPFLFNLFNDRAIINLPQPLRFLLAVFISFKRLSKARSIYQHLGGKSPITDLTQAQAEALEKKLKKENTNPAEDYKVFFCMRYWHPQSRIVAKKVKSYNPDHIVLLPLYPQFSTTTTASSFTDWDLACYAETLDVPDTRICCYPADLGFVAAHIKLIRETYWRAAEHGKPRILFSAHGLPEKIIESGDPYQWQVQRTVAAITQAMAIEEVDYAICYQSRVGPLKWIGPSIGEEIKRAAADQVPVLVVPVGFVSEHSETLVELDIQYKEMAEQLEVPGYWRTPALGTEELFIEALSDLCRRVQKSEAIQSFSQVRFCPRNFERCPCEA